MVKNERILIVEVNWLGDVLFSTPAIRALRNRFPNSYIGVLVHKRCKEILEGNPNVDEVIILDENGNHKGLLGKLELIGQLKAQHFDTVYLFHRSFTRTLICFLSGIRNRIGYYTPKRRFLLTESISPPKQEIHRAAYFYYLIAKSMPTNIETLHCDFFITDSDIFYINDILDKQNLNQNQKLVVMHPVGNWPPKRWPKENFARLADELIEKFAVSVVFSGELKEQGVISDILGLMKNKAINLAGKTTLKQLGALFKRADLVISADSGPLHISVALDRPTVAIFGPTSPVITGPLALQNTSILQKEINCVIPCYVDNCLDNRCMKQISVEDVINSIEEKRWLTKVK